LDPSFKGRTERQGVSVEAIAALRNVQADTVQGGPQPLHPHMVVKDIRQGCIFTLALT